MKKLKFYKNSSNRWFIDYPEWTGEQWELEMVMGADNLLDTIAQGSNEVILDVYEEEPSNYIYLLSEIKDQSMPTDTGGMYYYLYDKNNMNDSIYTVWLCHVTKFLYDGKFPDLLYINF